MSDRPSITVTCGEGSHHTGAPRGDGRMHDSAKEREKDKDKGKGRVRMNRLGQSIRGLVGLSSDQASTSSASNTSHLDEGMLGSPPKEKKGEEKSLSNESVHMNAFEKRDWGIQAGSTEGGRGNASGGRGSGEGKEEAEGVRRRRAFSGNPPRPHLPHLFSGKRKGAVTPGIARQGAMGEDEEEKGIHLRRGVDQESDLHESESATPTPGSNRTLKRVHSTPSLNRKGLLHSIGRKTSGAKVEPKEERRGKGENRGSVNDAKDEEGGLDHVLSLMRSLSPGGGDDHENGNVRKKGKIRESEMGLRLSSNVSGGGVFFGSKEKDKEDKIKEKEKAREKEREKEREREKDKDKERRSAMKRHSANGGGVWDKTKHRIIGPSKSFSPKPNAKMEEGMTLSASLCLSTSLFLCLCLPLSASLCLSASLRLSLPLSSSLPLSASICLSLLSASLCLSLPLSASLCLSLPLFASLCLSLRLSSSLPLFPLSSSLFLSLLSASTFLNLSLHIQIIQLIGLAASPSTPNSRIEVPEAPVEVNCLALQLLYMLYGS